MDTTPPSNGMGQDIVRLPHPPRDRGRSHEVLRDAGVVRRIAPLHPRRQALAVAWLTGTLDAEVALPVAWVSDALGIEHASLARLVRRHAL